MIGPSKGFILIITLLIISAISLLLLTSMQHILLYHKAINKQEELHQEFYQLENVAKQLAQKRLQLSSGACVARKDSPNQVIANLFDHQGCSLGSGDLQYQYFIEDLGEFPCLVVQSGGQKRATHHQRVSIVQMKDGMPISFLQIRYIAPGGMINCLTKERFTQLGISSWRYLPSL